MKGGRKVRSSMSGSWLSLVGRSRRVVGWQRVVGLERRKRRRRKRGGGQVWLRSNGLELDH